MTTSLRSSDNSFLDLLLSRRSVKPASWRSPDRRRLSSSTILTAASRVPDHKKLTPWRFIVFEGEARAAFGEVLAEACQAEEKPSRRPRSGSRSSAPGSCGRRRWSAVVSRVDA